jgi:hypothetical protein
MTYSIINTNLLNTNNLIFGGLVLGSASVIYLFGYTFYLGYNYYNISTNFKSDSITPNISNINLNSDSITPTPSITIKSGSTTPLAKSSISSPMSEIEYNEYVDNSTQTNLLFINNSNQTDLNLLIDNFNQTDLKILIDTSNQTMVGFPNISPFTSNTPVDSLPNNLIRLTSDVLIDAIPKTNDISVQTSKELLVNHLLTIIAEMEAENVAIMSDKAIQINPDFSTTLYGIDLADFYLLLL